MARGMVVTLRHLFRPAFTQDYPSKKRTLPERSRTSFTLPLGDDGSPMCKSCMLCEKSCPTDAISIQSAKREDGPGRVLERFVIDLGKCMYCGICVENCTSMGLKHTGDYETASPVRSDMTLVLYSNDAQTIAIAEEVASS